MHPSKVTLRPKVRRPMAWDSTKSAPSDSPAVASRETAELGNAEPGVEQRPDDEPLLRRPTHVCQAVRVLRHQGFATILLEGVRPSPRKAHAVRFPSARSAAWGSGEHGAWTPRNR